MFNWSRSYSLRKSRHIMRASYSLYKKKAHKLDAATKQALENDLQTLDQALLNKDRTTADTYARKLEDFNKVHFKKSVFEYALELVFALIMALAIATVVRQMWFELYEIPTGSMRPTFKEQDHLTVSKLAFGINQPLQTDHFYFDPNLVQRTSILIFSGDKIPYIDATTTYFWVIPYKKRYIKRTIGKPGDSLYFYGGKIYLVDKDGNPDKAFLEAPWMEKIEHVPFLTFEGMPTSPNPNSIEFNQMHLPLGRIQISFTGDMVGQVYNGKEWVKDDPAAINKPHNSIQTYSDFMGIRNYGMARLITKEQLNKASQAEWKDIESAPLYLEIRHTPNLTNPKPTFHRDRRGYGILLTPFTTVIPLQQEDLNRLMDNMYTARFVVKDSKGTRYSLGEENARGNSRFSGVPDGTYEFYHGKGVKIGFGGIAMALPDDHPLNQRTPENIQRLYNFGIDTDVVYAPKAAGEGYFPQRYVYFKDGDLYAMGSPLLKKESPTLVTFNEREIKREGNSSNSSYFAFKDYGPPLKDDGTYDVDFIRSFGVTVPENHYLVLGDNHAMSSDSRVFGFVPQQNLQGAPSLIIWPPGDRLGPPAQKPYPIINVPRLIIWSIALIIFLIWYAIHRYRLSRPIFKKID